MLITGSFLYSEDFRLLNNVAKGSDAHVYTCDVVHDVRDDGYWFGGLFQYAGSELKFLSDAPVESFSIAHYTPEKNLDPNNGLEIDANQRVKGVKGYSSESRKSALKATCPEGGEVVWYAKSTNGKFRKVATGNVYNASF